jgi:AraC-like DNA-binding protein
MAHNETQTFVFDYRPSDAPTVEFVWHTLSAGPATPAFISRASTHWEMVVMRQRGRTTLTVRGPETRARLAPIPSDAEFFGITFKLGTLLRPLPASRLVDQNLDLPEAGANSFWLNGSAWQYPTYENADLFLARLARQALLTPEPLVPAALQGELPALALSQRSVQRRFRHATGLTYSAVTQIERAHRAQALLQAGRPILDVVAEGGYADQPHLTRSLRRFLGETPAQIARQAATPALSTP